MKRITIISISLNILFVVSGLGVIHAKGGMQWVWSKLAPIEAQNTWYSVWDQAVPPDGSIVIYGDSILALGDWDCFCRAHPGDTTEMLVRRIHHVGKPSTVILNGGINDLQSGMPREFVVDNYRKIIDCVDADVVIVPLLPINTEMYRDNIVPICPSVIEPALEDIKWINQQLVTMANTVDVSDLVCGDQLLAEATSDGLHLNGYGLSVLAGAIKKTCHIDVSRLNN